MQPAVIFAPVEPLDREPVDEIGVGGAADAPEQRQPRAERVDPRPQAVPRPVDTRPRLSVEPVGRVLDQRVEPLAERHQRAQQCLDRVARGGGGRHQLGIGVGKLGLQPIAAVGLLRIGAARIDLSAHRGEQPFDRPQGAFSASRASQPSPGSSAAAAIAAWIARSPASS